MELLRKTTSENKGLDEDSSGKKELFEKGRIHPANFYKDEWSFIEDPRTRENIAYHIQYLEFCICLYNQYAIYFTIESLLCKNIMATIAVIIESALFDMVNQASKKANFNFDEKRDFLSRIDMAFDMELIDMDMKDAFHDLRKLRNRIHLSGAEEREYSAYSVEEANKYIKILDKFREINTKNHLG